MFHCHGFVMVRHGLWCFTVMVSSWFIMVRHGLLSWFHHGSWCFTVMVLSWFVMVCHGSLSWFCHSSSWFTVMVRHGSSWFTVMVHHGSSWFVMVHCHGFVMVRQNSPEEGHVTLYSANQGLKFTIKSHFWWDFSFSPFHLKSIPLKSSAKNQCLCRFRCNIMCLISKCNSKYMRINLHKKTYISIIYVIVITWI